jgi:hypothetical protein
LTLRVRQESNEASKKDHFFGEILLKLLAIDQDVALQTMAVELNDLMKEIKEKDNRKTK